MILLGRRDVGSVCFLRSVEAAKMYHSIVDPDASSITSGVFAEYDALEAGAVAALNSPVLHVLRGSGEPKIRPAIIGLNAIAMVDLLTWPSSSHPKDGKAAREITFACNANRDPSVEQASGFLASTLVGMAPIAIDTPSEEPGGGVVR